MRSLKKNTEIAIEHPNKDCQLKIDKYFSLY